MVQMSASSRTSERKLLGVAVLAGCIAVAAFLMEVKLRIGGDSVAIAVTDIGEALFALTAATACAFTARRSTGNLRMAWTLIAASAFSWGLGAVVWSISEVGLGISPVSPSLSDIGYLAAYPFALVGFLALPLASNATNRWRAVLDGGIVSGSLIFVAWSLGLSSVYNDSGLGDLGRGIAAAYPVLDFVLITLLVLALGRSSGRMRISILILLTGFLANTVADSLHAFSSLGGSFGTLGSLLDTGWVIGYLLIALAAIWPTYASPDKVDDVPVEPWQLALPWLGVIAMMGAAGWVSVSGQQWGTTGTVIALTVGLLFVTSQGLLLGDTARLMRLSRAAEAHATESMALLNEVITQAPSGIARAGLDLRLLDANPKLCSMLHMEAASVIGASVAEFLAPADLQQVRDSTSGLIEGKVETIQGESKVHRPDGTAAWMLWTVTAVRKSRRDIEYFIVMFEDISAKHEAEEAAEANLAASEKLSRLKSEFLSMVSHEFRTALTGIQGYSEILNTQEVTPVEVKEFSGDINADSLRLNRMITEMLDFDRIESGRVRLHLAPLDLNQVLREQTERAQFTTTKHVLKTELDPTVALVDGDSDRIVQVVANLLSNAIKYSPEGGEIVVRSRIVDGNVEVSVRDHGQGIPADFLRKIFGRYERYEAAGKNQVVGTGLGLAIAQQIIQLHKGRIWVDSEVGKGSEFHFTIPVASVDATGSTADPGAVVLPAQKVA